MGYDDGAETPRARWGSARRAARIIACAALWVAWTASGCATTSQDQALRAEMTALQTRVDELEQTNRRLHARLNQHDHTLQLIDDQLRSQRLAATPPPPSGPRHTTIHLSPPGYRQDPYQRGGYEPYAQAVDGRALEAGAGSDLTHNADNSASGLDGFDHFDRFDSGDDGDDGEEIVVTDERVRAFIGAHGGSYGSSGDTPAQASGGAVVRIPKAPVVHGDRLDVMPIDRQGRVVSGSPPPDAASASPLDAPPLARPPALATPSAANEAAASGDPIQPYRDGLDAYRSADYATAIRHFERFLNGNPPYDYIDNALYWLGDAYYGMGNYTQAAAYFHRVVKEYPNENKVPDALLKVGLTYQRLGREPSAREVFQYLIDTYPRSEAARLARDKLSTAADAPAL